MHNGCASKNTIFVNTSDAKTMKLCRMVVAMPNFNSLVSLA